MALWQYTFHVLTKESFDFFNSEFMLSELDFIFDDEKYWRFKPVNRSIFEKVELILGKGMSWSNEMDLYGYMESNCFEVVFDLRSNLVKSASFRIDFSSYFEKILFEIIEFCISNDLIILSESLDFIELKLEIVMRTIRNSTQMKKYNDLNADIS